MNLKTLERNIDYSGSKDDLLQRERGIGFEKVIDAIIEGGLLDIREHHNPIMYPNQKLMYVKIGVEVYIIPFIKEDDGPYFLKTIYPSRKARKEFLGIA